jgi:hypothetical protein
MGGCDTLIEMSADQLEGMAGGKFLRAEAMSAATRENVVRGTIKTLRDAFLSSGTAIPLLLLIAQVRGEERRCDTGRGGQWRGGEGMGKVEIVGKK